MRTIDKFLCVLTIILTTVILVWYTIHIIRSLAASDLELVVILLSLYSLRKAVREFE
jgi:hypothetical protein